jgi:hypothetical protein
VSNEVEEVWGKYSGEGTGGKAASFTEKGVVFKGVLMEPPIEKQQTTPSGDLKWFDKEETQPRMQLVFKFQTDERDPEDPEDTGVRSLWTKIEQIRAIRDALKEAGEKVPRIGGTLELAWTSSTPPKVKGWNPTKHFTARWTPPPISLLAEEKKSSSFDFDSAPVNTNSAESPLDSLRGMQGRGNAGLPANLQNETPPF